MNSFEIVKIVCDRCHNTVEGFRSSYGTGGFYEYPAWKDYMNKDERVICDKCLWRDNRYKKAYP